jgi:glycolate oxidase iron-sulfur subunit
MLQEQDRVNPKKRKTRIQVNELDDANLCLHIESLKPSNQNTVAGNSSDNLSHLRGLDYSVVQQCMHCGLCLPTCPTYDKTKVERNSPRGRIALMRAIADRELEATRTFGDEMYFCLGCLACMTACPAGVNYAELFEHARAEAEASGQLKSPKRNLIRAFTLRWLFDDLRRLKTIGRLIRLYQEMGLQTLIRCSGILRFLPRRLRELESMTPTIQPGFSEDLIAPLTVPRGAKRFRVALLTGCAQDLIFSDVNRDTAEVLARNGCEVITPPEQHCCGSLHAHNGEWELAQEMARRNIDQFPPDQFDAIITNAAGCGSHLKHYAKLLHDDQAYQTRAQEWDRKVKDIHEWLVEIGWEPPRTVPRSRRSNEADAQIRNPKSEIRNSNDPPHAGGYNRVTYHEACHLCHGQKITTQPRDILKSIPGVELVELPESTWCCGSAGIYNVIQPEMAGELLDRKLKHIRTTGAPVVATANPGCLLQIQNGALRDRLPLRIVHPITLLAEAYRRE